MQKILTYLLFALLMASCCKRYDDHAQKHFLQIYADESVHDLTLYVFDENQLFIDSVAVTGIVTEPGAVSVTQIRLDHPGQCKITAVVWGNASNGLQRVSPLAKGTHLRQAFVELKTFDGPVLLALSPDDLFRGYLEINMRQCREGAAYHRMTLMRKVSSVQIMTRGLHQFTGTADSDFQYIIGTTYGRLSFQGVFSEAKVSYLPSSFFNANDDFVTPVFFTFPSVPGEAIHVYIYHAGELILTVSEDKNGNPLVLNENKRLNISINLLGGGLLVSLQVQPWNTINIDQWFEGD